MTDREALVAAVAASPDDDLPKLVFADWLEEHGEPDRAEFIRVCCTPGFPDVRATRSRARELFDRHFADWCRPVFQAVNGVRPSARWREWWVRLGSRPAEPLDPPTASDSLPDGSILVWPGAGDGYHTLRFRKGFICEVGVTGAALTPETLPGVLRLEPVTGVRVEDPIAAARAGVFDAPALARVRLLSLLWSAEEPTGREVAGTRALLTAPGWSGVRELNLGIQWEYPNAILDAVLASDLAARVERVRLCVRRPELFSAVCELPTAARLRGLAVWVPPNSDDGYWPLTHATFRPTLERLDLSDPGRPGTTLRPLFTGPPWTRLRELALRRVLHYDHDECDALARSDAFPALESLDLSWNALDYPVAVVLAGSPLLQQLTHIDLSHNAIRDTAARVLATEAMSSPLRRLDLRGNPISPGAADQIRSWLGDRVLI